MIRPADDSDLADVVQMARKFHACTEYTEIPFDEETAGELFYASVAQGLCFVAERNESLVGFILGLAFPSVLNKSVQMGSELAWWVDPEYRGSILSLKLLRHIEQAAQHMGLKAWSMICLESLSPNEIEDIYLRSGYRKTERAFIKFF